MPPCDPLLLGGASLARPRHAPLDLAATSTDATNDGYVTVRSRGIERPVTSNLDLTRGNTTTNLVLTKIGTNHRTCPNTQTGAHLIADLAAWQPANTG